MKWLSDENIPEIIERLIEPIYINWEILLFLKMKSKYDKQIWIDGVIFPFCLSLQKTCYNG